MYVSVKDGCLEVHEFPNAEEEQAEGGDLEPEMKAPNQNITKLMNLHYSQLKEAANKPREVVGDDQSNKIKVLTLEGGGVKILH